MKAKSFLVLLWFVYSFSMYGQKEDGLVYYQSFDDIKTDIKKVQSEFINSTSLQGLFQPVYSKGIKGKALDLTENTPLRIPLCLTEQEIPSYDKESSFSIQLWVQTLKNARQGTPIISNKRMEEKDSIGWCIGTQENGAWMWNISDGKVTFSYEPTAERQAINDGEWHQITISVDRENDEMWMYLDGKNVAIYQIKNSFFSSRDSYLGSVSSGCRTIIGGSDEKYDFGSQREWTAFNGKIDEVRIWSRPVHADEVWANYEQFKPSAVKTQAVKPDRLKVLMWNIWHGGHRFGQHVGVKRVAEILQSENPDIIGMTETYGSGAILADSLGYYFYLISTNLSIMSRYPIEETIKVFRPFNSGGALIDVGEDQKIAFFNIWLWYQPGLPDKQIQDPAVVAQYVKEEKARRLVEVTSMLTDMQPYMKNADNVPVFMVGDFNSISHLDINESTSVLRRGVTFECPISEAALGTGLKDSYRECHPDALLTPGYTWSPLYEAHDPGILKHEHIKKRIDYIYFKGEKLTVYQSKTLSHHPVFWPSDHASVISMFYLK